MKNFIIGYTTTPTIKEAKKIAQILVKERLVACVNIFPIFSIYQWKGRIEKTKEYGIFLKTKKKLLPQIEKKIQKIHSYSLPCLIYFSIEGEKNYLQWLEKSTI